MNKKSLLSILFGLYQPITIKRNVGNMIFYTVPLIMTGLSVNESAFNNYSVLTVYCEIEEQPEACDYLWNPEKAEVEWGYKG